MVSGISEASFCATSLDFWASVEFPLLADCHQLWLCVLSCLSSQSFLESCAAFYSEYCFQSCFHSTGVWFAKSHAWLNRCVAGFIYSRLGNRRNLSKSEVGGLSPNSLPAMGKLRECFTTHYELPQLVGKNKK